MNKKLFLIILATLCLVFALCSCSCSNEEDYDHNHNHVSSSQNGSSGTTPDNQNPVTPGAPDIECDHYWSKVNIDKNTTSTSSVYLYGECWLCGASLSSESIATVSYDEWKNALSSDSLKSFTVFAGNTYTDYDEKSSASWRVRDDVYTEEFLINSPSKNSASFLTENYSGYIMMYDRFTYNMEKRTYVYRINDTSYIELGFADGQLIYHATVSNDGENEEKHESIYLNHNKISITVPSYFNDSFNNMIKRENIGGTVSDSMKDSIASFLSTLNFNGQYEIALLENSGLSVYFYFEESATDPIFNGEYTSVSIIAKDDKITSVTIGTNTIELQ